MAAPGIPLAVRVGARVKCDILGPSSQQALSWGSCSHRPNGIQRDNTFHGPSLAEESS